MANIVPQPQTVTPEPIGLTPGAFRGQTLTLEPYRFVIRTYDSTLHKGRIRVLEGQLWVYENDEVVRKIRQNDNYNVDLSGPNKLGSGEDGVSFVETYRQ